MEEETNKEEIKQDDTKPIEEEKVEVDDVIFEYIVPKTGMYKIKLNENEKLIIKD